MITRQRVVFLFRVVLGVVFICAAIPKIISPYEFAESVFRYQLAPYSTVNITAIFLPWLELVIGVCLLFVRKFRGGAAVIVLGLMIFFTLLILVTLYRGIDISCGCFSVNPDASRIGWKKAAENILLTIMAVFVVIDSWRSKSALLAKTD